MPYTAWDLPGSHSKDALPTSLPRPQRPRIHLSSRNGMSGSVPSSPSMDQGRRQGFLMDCVPRILPLPALLKPKVPLRRQREAGFPSEKMDFWMDFPFVFCFVLFCLFFSEEDGGFFGWDAMGFVQLFFLLWRHVSDRDTPTATDCGEGLCHIPMDPGKSPERTDRKDGCKLIQCKCLP